MSTSDVSHSAPLTAQADQSCPLRQAAPRPRVPDTAAGRSQKLADERGALLLPLTGAPACVCHTRDIGRDLSVHEKCTCTSNQKAPAPLPARTGHRRRGRRAREAAACSIVAAPPLLAAQLPGRQLLRRHLHGDNERMAAFGWSASGRRDATMSQITTHVCKRNCVTEPECSQRWQHDEGGIFRAQIMTMSVCALRLEHTQVSAADTEFTPGSSLMLNFFLNAASTFRFFCSASRSACCTSSAVCFTTRSRLNE